MDATIEGAKAVEESLRQLPAKLQKKAIRPAMRDGMKSIVLRDAKRRAPVDTGQLHRSLKVRTAKARGNKRLPRGVLGYQVQAAKTKTTDAYYAVWVFADAKNRDGTVRRGTRTLRTALYGNAAALRTYVSGQIRHILPSVVRDAKIASLRYKGK